MKHIIVWSVAAILGMGGLMGLWSVANADPKVGNADVTWADPEPNIGDPWAWAACVTTVYNMGGGTDADMGTCDRLYPVADDIVADCLFNAGESDGIAWGDETARCTWKYRD